MLVSFATVALVAVSLGWVAGRRFECAARGWADYRARRAEVPVLLALARVLSVRAAGAVTLALAVAGFALYVLAVEGR
ncbi:MAG: hypothetical protein ACRDJ9_33880 [Dehalococcoidia bacterium]